MNSFARRFGLRMPLLLAPMAGACPVDLSLAVGRAGGMAAMGALLHQPEGIAQWVADFRAGGGGTLQINLWVPDPPPRRDATHEAKVRAFLAGFGPAVLPEAGDSQPPFFDAQCQAVLAAKPSAVSTIMGLLPAPWVQRFKAADIAWFATVTTVAEARLAQAAGADVIVAQGAEAGGHRGAFVADHGREAAVGLFALLPQVVDAVRVPVVATGGIADARGVAAALLLGASAVQIGSAFLRCPEAGIAAPWARLLDGLPPEGTQLTRAFSGRWGRAVSTEFVRAAAGADAPMPAPYPVQRGLTAAMRKAAELAGDGQRMQAWAGQGVGLSVGGLALPAEELSLSLWHQAQALLSDGPLHDQG